MRRSSTAGFRKLLTCPRTEALLLSSRGDEAASETFEAQHARSCDFCGAEMQLLSRFPPPANALPFAAFSMPAPLRLLAREILSEPSYNRARFADSIMEIERLTLTDA